MSFVKCDLFINVEDDGGEDGDDSDGGDEDDDGDDEDDGGGSDDGDGGDWRFLSINSVGLDLSQHHWK